MQRRDFFKVLSVGGALAASSAWLPRALAQTAPDRRFIFCYFGGGWDTLMCLDPRDPARFNDSTVRETQIQPGYDRLPAEVGRAPVMGRGSDILFGPAAARLAPHSDKLCVVRGMMMDTLTHEVGRRYMITGQLPAGLAATGSSMGSRIVAQQGEATAVPFLAARMETYAHDLPVYAQALAVNGPSDLVLTLRRIDTPTAPVRRHLEAMRAGELQCDPTNKDRAGMLGLIREVRAKAGDLVGSNLDARFDFAANTPEMQAIRRQYGFTPNPRGGVSGPGEQAALAAQAIKNDIAQCVSVSLMTNLDTHDDTWADEHSVDLKAGFDAVATLVEDLDASGHLAKTTIVCFSEFSRSPVINNRDGRDHAIFNSCLLLGAGVPHNRVVGATSDLGMSPLPIDPATGLHRPDGITLTPTKVMASVMASAGLSPAALRVDPLPCLMG